MNSGVGVNSTPAIMAVRSPSIQATLSGTDCQEKANVQTLMGRHIHIHRHRGLVCASSNIIPSRPPPMVRRRPGMFGKRPRRNNSASLLILSSRIASKMTSSPLSANSNPALPRWCRETSRRIPRPNLRGGSRSMRSSGVSSSCS